MKKDRGAILLVLAFLAVVYGFTLARDYTWKHWGSDAGDLIAAIYTLGVPHPPGTPLYILLTQPFRFLPFGVPAFKINLASAVFALLAILVLMKTVLRLGRGNRLAAIGAGLFLGLSPVFWSQAIITEVLTLHVLLSGLVVYSIVRLEKGDGEKWLPLSILFLGLALANHTTSAMLVPPLGYVVLSRYGLDFFKPRRLFSSGAALLLGLAPYLYLPIRARREPPINWGRPDSLSRFLAHVTGAQYRAMLFHQNPVLVIDGAVRFLSSLAANFTYLGLLLAAVGLVLTRQEWRLKVFTAFVFFFQVLFVSEYKIANIETFNLAAFWVVSLWIGLGFRVVGRMLEDFKAGLREKMPVLLLRVEKPAFLGGGQFVYPLADFILFMAILLIFLIPVARLPRLWPAIDASRDREAARYGGGVFDVLKPGAIVFTEGDKFSLALEYQRWVLHPERDDVAVMVNGLYLQDWRLEHYRRLYPQLTFPDRPITRDKKQAFDDLLEMIALNIDTHPVYLTLDYPPPKPHLTHRLEVNGWTLQSEGPIYRVLGKI
jgi:hypothetical protein